MITVKKIIILFIATLHYVGAYTFAAPSLVITYKGRSKPADTLVVYVWPELIAPARRYDIPHREYRAGNEGGVYRIALDPVPGIAYCSIGFHGNRINGMVLPILEDYLIENDDSVSIRLGERPGSRSQRLGLYDSGEEVVAGYEIEISGRNVQKWVCRQGLDSVPFLNGQKRAKEGQEKLTGASYYLNLMKRDSLDFKQQLGILDGHRAVLGEDGYYRMKADLVGRVGHKGIRYLENIIWTAKKAPDFYASTFLDSIYRIYGQYCLPPLGKDIPGEYLLQSPYYLEYMETKLFNERAISMSGGSLKGLFDLIADVSPPIMKDRLLTFFLLARASGFLSGQELEELINRSEAMFTDPLCRTALSGLKNRKLGSMVYGFSLYDINGSEVSLDAFKGKVVFVDFWFASCGPCHIYYDEVVKPVQDSLADRRDVIWMFISVDTFDRFRKAMESLGTKSNNGIYLYTNNQGVNHPVIANYGISAFPFPLLVGKDGTLEAQGASLTSTAGLMTQITCALEK